MSPLYVPQAPFPTNYLAPTGMAAETFPRNSQNVGAIGIATGTLYLVGINLPAGLSIGHIVFHGVAAAVTPTHWWFGLYDSSRVQLATTADQTTTAWAGNTAKNLAVATIASGAASAFVTTYTGMHYLGICQVATTPATMAIAVMGFTAQSIAPIPAGLSSTAQTTPPAFAFTAGAITSSSNYAYATVGA